MLELDKTTFEAEVLQAPGKIVVDFYGDGCVPCAALMPHVHGFADVYGDKLKFCALNTTKARRLAISQKILGLPVIAPGGKTPESIRETIAAGANAIIWTPPSAQQLQTDMMQRYRKMKEDATPENVEAMIKKYI